MSIFWALTESRLDWLKMLGDWMTEGKSQEPCFFQLGTLKNAIFTWSLPLFFIICRLHFINTIFFTILWEKTIYIFKLYKCVTLKFSDILILSQIKHMLEIKLYWLGSIWEKCIIYMYIYMCDLLNCSCITSVLFKMVAVFCYLIHQLKISWHCQILFISCHNDNIVLQVHCYS